jgi:hypothetical protein
MADNAYKQYANPPFGTVAQSSGLAGSETGGDRGTPDNGPATAPQSYRTGAESIGSQNPGAHYIDAGTAQYTNPFDLLNGSPAAGAAVGSTGTALSSAAINGVGDYDTPDGSETGIGHGSVGHGIRRS